MFAHYKSKSNLSSGSKTLGSFSLAMPFRFFNPFNMCIAHYFDPYVSSCICQNWIPFYQFLLPLLPFFRFLHMTFPDKALTALLHKARVLFDTLYCVWWRVMLHNGKHNSHSASRHTLKIIQVPGHISHKQVFMPGYYFLLKVRMSMQPGVNSLPNHGDH